MLEFEHGHEDAASGPATVTGLTGFFEAAVAVRAQRHLLPGVRRRTTPARPRSAPRRTTTPASPTRRRPRPTGPWTYRGRSSLRSRRPRVIRPSLEFDGEWYIAYHTADAAGGNHFRRSVAIDHARVGRHDDARPDDARDDDARTRARPHAALQRRARRRRSPASNEPVPTQYWVKSLNDEIVRPNPLPPDMWGTWSGNHPPQQWVQYDWDQPMRVAGPADRVLARPPPAQASASPTRRRGRSSTGTTASGATCRTRAATRPPRRWCTR